MKDWLRLHVMQPFSDQDSGEIYVLAREVLAVRRASNGSHVFAGSRTFEVRETLDEIMAAYAEAIKIDPGPFDYYMECLAGS